MSDVYAVSINSIVAVLTVVSKHNRIYHQQTGLLLNYAQLPTGEQLATDNQQYEADSIQLCGVCGCH